MSKVHYLAVQGEYATVEIRRWFPVHVEEITKSKTDILKQFCQDMGIPYTDEPLSRNLRWADILGDPAYDEVVRLRAERAVKIEKISNLSNENSRLKQENTKLLGEVQNTNSGNERLANENKVLRARIATLEATVKDRNERVAVLEKQVTCLTMDRNPTQDVLNHMQELYRKATQANTQLKQEFNDLHSYDTEVIRRYSDMLVTVVDRYGHIMDGHTFAAISQLAEDMILLSWLRPTKKNTKPLVWFSTLKVVVHLMWFKSLTMNYERTFYYHDNYNPNKFYGTYRRYI